MSRDVDHVRAGVTLIASTFIHETQSLVANFACLIPSDVAIRVEDEVPAAVLTPHGNIQGRRWCVTPDTCADYTALN